MKRTCSTHCVLCALFSVVLPLAILFFLATVGLGSYAIVNAGTFAEYCVDSDPATPCAFSANASSLNVAGSIDTYAGSQYPYWLAGACGVAVMCSLFATFALCVSVELLKESQLERFKKNKGRYELKALAKADSTAEGGGATSGGGASTLGEVADVSNGNEDHTNIEGVDGVHQRRVKVSIDVIGGEEVKEWQGTTVRGFIPLAGVVLFIGILAAMCALLCMLWGIAISYNQYSPHQLASVIGSAYNCNTLNGTCILNSNISSTTNNAIKITSYITVNILIGMVAPILLIVSTALVAIVVDYITVGQLDMRKAICYILPSVTAQEGKENNYWTILDTFYFTLSKRPDRSKHGFLYSCDKSRYTWYFSIVCALSILLVFSYFVDLTVTEEFASKTCPSDTTYVCFNQKNYLYINCSQALNLSVKSIICFKFLRFGVDVNLITALSQSFAFYLLINTFFTQIFTIVKALISIKPSRFWGIGLILFSFLLIGGAIAVLVESDVLVAYTGILSILEFFMVGFAVFVIGVLLVEGKWWEKIPPFEAKPIHFVQYDDTSRRKLEEIHHSVALEEENRVEIEHNLIEPVLK